MLEQFRQAKESEIARLMHESMPRPFAGRRADFATALRRAPMEVIAEYKRASPSRGVIRQNLDVGAAARAYLRNGAAAMSVLTEESWFGGELCHLRRAHEATGGALPLLRKDFLFDPLQVEATAATPAAALLLIVRMLPGMSELRELIALAAKFGLAAVVEIFDENDLEAARSAGATIIQVNARDLDTLRVSRAAANALIAANPPRAGETWIAASGISEAAHLAQARAGGFHAALVGTALMEKPDPGAALAELLNGAGQCS